MSEQAPLALSPDERKAIVRESLYNCQTVPWEQLSPAIDAIKEGATYRLAAKAAGLSKWVFDTMLEFGAAGHPVWQPLFEAVERADAISQIPTMQTLKKQSEDGNTVARKEYMQIKAPDEWGSMIPQGADSRAVRGLSLPGGINVQIAQFAPPGGNGNAAQERLDAGGDIIEHQQASERRLPARSSRGDSVAKGGEVEKEEEEN